MVLTRSEKFARVTRSLSETLLSWYGLLSGATTTPCAHWSPKGSSAHRRVRAALVAVRAHDDNDVLAAPREEGEQAGG